MCERLALCAAHLAHLGVTGASHVLLAPVPERGALVIVDPCVCAALVPDRVGRLLAFEMPKLDGWAIEPPDDDDDVLHDVADVDADDDVFVTGGPAGFGGLRLVPPPPRAGGGST